MWHKRPKIASLGEKRRSCGRIEPMTLRRLILSSTKTCHKHPHNRSRYNKRFYGTVIYCPSVGTQGCELHSLVVSQFPLNQDISVHWELEIFGRLFHPRTHLLPPIVGKSQFCVLRAWWSRDPLISGQILPTRTILRIRSRVIASTNVVFS